MSQHPHVTTVDRMTGAVLGGDRTTLEGLLTEDFTFHYRGPFPAPGDHTAQRVGFPSTSVSVKSCAIR